MGGRGSSSATAGAGGVTQPQGLPLPASAVVSDYAEKYAELTTANKTYSLADRFPDFVLDKLTQSELQAIHTTSSSGDWKIKKETEKAVLVSIATDYGKVEFWSPKSVIRTDEQMRAYAKKENKSAFERAAYHVYLMDKAHVSYDDISWKKMQDRITKLGKEYMSFDAFKASNGLKAFEGHIDDISWRLYYWGYPTKW